MGSSKNQIFTFSLALLLFISLISAQSEIRIGEQIAYQNLGNKQWKYYKVNINRDNFSGKEDLIVQVLTTKFSSDPDVFISKNYDKPNSKYNSEWICSTIGRDTCSINSKSIALGDTFYIGVTCDQECQFTIKPSLQKEIELYDGQEMQLHFNPYETKIFQFKVPPLSKIQDQKIKSIQITAAPFLPGTQDLILTASTKSHITANSASKRGVPAWSKGEVLRLSDQIPEDWCTDCIITMMVDVVDGGEYRISAKTNTQEQRLIMDKKLDDAAYNGDLQCYTYRVNDQKKDVKLSLTQYSGMISLYVNPEEKAPQYNESLYSLTGSYNSQLTIPAKDRNKRKGETNNYYVCIFPHLPSSYSLLVQEIEPNLEFNYLDDGFTQRNDIQGKNMQLFMYKVPALDTNQEVNLDFQISTISGKMPILAVSFCDELEYQKCTKDLYKEFVTDPKGKFQKAKGNDHSSKLVLDHKQKYCQEKFNGECYYIVAVIGTAENQNITSYQLEVFHSQQEHIVLQENKQVTGTVNNEEYKYYKFTLLDSQKVKNVTFIMNTLHGDSDIFVSRKIKEPRKYEFEKSSQNSLGLVDIVGYYGKDLASTYYIGVYGYQYSTFNLMVKIEREGSNNVQNIPQLIEGIPSKGRINDKFKIEQYKFETKMQQGYEKSIRIQLSPFEGKMKIYAKYGSQATNKDYHWSSENNQIVISTSDKNFHREGIYYIAIEPAYTVWEVLFEMKYVYMISYSTESQFTYLQSSTGLEIRQSPKQKNYFRHFVSDSNSDIKLSLTVFSGQPQVYIGINPNNKQPNKDNNDIPLNSKVGYTYKLERDKLQKANRACIDQGISSEDTCAVYIGVECKEECQYTIKIWYDNSLPHQLMIGMPQHDTVRSGEFNYYYLKLKNNQIKEVYAVLTTLQGNADLYMKYQQDALSQNINSWKLPTQNNYDQKSTETLSQDIIRIKQSDIEKCFETRNNKQVEECTLQFGIYGQNSNDKKHSESNYNFVVYSDVAFLQNNSPITNTVEQGEYKYFIYQATCQDCTIIMSLSTFGSGDPDLYIAYGDSRLPTKTEYDIASATYKSEVVQIDLNHQFFVKNKIKSMQGSYIIAVYGSKNSTFTLSVSQEQHPMVLLKEGFSTKINQDKYDILYYKWYNWDEQDVKIQLNVKSGLADLYISTFDESDISQNLLKRLPNSKKSVKWISENITPVSSIDDQSILIKSKDRDYCTNCVFLIGVVTHEQNVEYNLLIEKLHADFSNSLFLRIGEQQVAKLSKGEKKIFKFMIEEKAALNMQYTVKSGKARFELGIKDKPDKEIIFSSEGTAQYSIKPDHDDFMVDQLYQLTVINTYQNDTEIELFITTNRTIMKLIDGQPLLLVFDGMQDVSKYMTFSIPEGDSSVQIQVKSKKEDFYPIFYYKFYENIDKEKHKIQFPPGGDPEFVKSRNWDKVLGLLTISLSFKGVKGKQAGVAMSLFDNSWQREYHTNDPVIVTASLSPIINMMLNTMQIGSLSHDTSFKMYKVQTNDLQSKNGSFVVEFAECLGQSGIAILSKPTQSPSNIIPHNEMQGYGKKYIFVTLPQDIIYIYVAPKVLEENYLGLQTPRTDYLIKGYFSKKPYIHEKVYELQNDGKISYQILSPTSLNISWGAVDYQLATETSFTEKRRVPSVTYHLIESNELRARLDTICAMRKEFVDEFNYKIMQSKEPHFTLNYPESGEVLKFNVIAQTNENGDQEGEIIPYQSIMITLGQSTSQSYFKGLAFWLYSIFVIAFIFGAYYFFKKGKSSEIIHKQAEYEMTDVKSGGYYGVPSDNQSYTA